MGRLIFITGGARSGKSRLAVKLAGKAGKRVAFIATSAPGDDEMKARIAKHRNDRPRGWRTVEEELDAAAAICGIPRTTDAVILDCLTLLVSNLMLAGKSDARIVGEIRAVVSAARRAPFTTIVVSNEVGCGIVPENALARKFRDVVGTANQVIAQGADEVYAMISGLPLKLK
jgi:adenosylcobinamide kinase/adenosylcobinamide-phosphate guanylyltransferase